MPSYLTADIFDELNAKNAIACALLMSHIDGEVHEKEWAVIQKFVNAHWKPDYQDFKQAKVDVEQEIKPYLIDSLGFQGVLGELVDNLTKKMSSGQKTILLKLVNDVMVADGVMKAEEVRLFETFKEKIQVKGSFKNNFT